MILTGVLNLLAPPPARQAPARQAPARQAPSHMLDVRRADSQVKSLYTGLLFVLTNHQTTANVSISYASWRQKEQSGT